VAIIGRCPISFAAAVTLPPQHALILAGAGSGKTRVLTTRIAWLIQTGQVGPHGVLAVTFTNKAAKEMLTRLSAMLPINTRGMWIGTFHGLCNRLLRAHHRDAGLPQLFQILDSADQLAAIKRCSRRSMSMTRNSPPGRANFINGQKEAGLSPDAVEAWDDYTRSASSCIANTRRSASARAWWISPSCCCAPTSCSPATSRCAALPERFRHILVDEFQDTNRLQYRC
jgi:DNA helicase-2/ATP-dependent DNA helicase PcrA